MYKFFSDVDERDEILMVQLECNGTGGKEKNNNHRKKNTTSYSSMKINTMFPKYKVVKCNATARMKWR